MDEYYFSADLGDNRTLHLTPLTNRWLAMCGDDIADQSGYFLFEKSGCGETASIEIIAQVFSNEAAFRLREMFGMV